MRKISTILSIVAFKVVYFILFILAIGPEKCSKCKMLILTTKNVVTITDKNGRRMMHVKCFRASGL